MKACLQRKRFESMGRIKVENSAAVLQRIWQNMTPGSSEVSHMLSQLLEEMTKEGLAAQLDTKRSVLEQWLIGNIRWKTHPGYARLKLIWLLWSIRFKPENLATWRSILTWGNMKGP